MTKKAVMLFAAALCVRPGYRGSRRVLGVCLGRGPMAMRLRFRGRRFRRLFHDQLPVGVHGER
jgi:hypothetical protein